MTLDEATQLVARYANDIEKLKSRLIQAEKQLDDAQNRVIEIRRTKGELESAQAQANAELRALMREEG